MNQTRVRAVALTLLAGHLLVAGPAMGVEKAAVFPFDLRDIEQEGEIVPQFKPDDLRRLKLVAEELKDLMRKSGKFEIADLSKQEAAIQQVAPLVDCDGCEAAIAKEAGAQLAVTGQAEKWSDAMISLRLFVRDVGSGQLKQAMQAEIRGNTDELWLHALRWLWRNRFALQEKPAESKN